MVVQVFDQEFGIGAATLVRCKNGILQHKIIFGNRLAIVSSKTLIGYLQFGCTIL
jgi:hypothetical protein